MVGNFNDFSEESIDPFLPEFVKLGSGGNCVDRKLFDRDPIVKPIEFDGKSISLKAFLLNFEVVSKINNWNKDEKALMLVASMRGEAVECISKVPSCDLEDYQMLRKRLESRFCNGDGISTYTTARKIKVSKPWWIPYYSEYRSTPLCWTCGSNFHNRSSCPKVQVNPLPQFSTIVGDLGDFKVEEVVSKGEDEKVYNVIPAPMVSFESHPNVVASERPIEIDSRELYEVRRKRAMAEVRKRVRRLKRKREKKIEDDVHVDKVIRVAKSEPIILAVSHDSDITFHDSYYNPKIPGGMQVELFEEQVINRF